MIIPELCPYCTLRYLVGASYLDIIVSAGISTSSFYRIVHKTIHAINLMDELSIDFPQTMAECRAAVAGFNNISYQSAIANCIGALDGYLVAINTPPSLVIVLRVNNLSHTILMAKRLSHGKSLATIKLVHGACTFGTKNLARQTHLVDVQNLAHKIIFSAITKLDSLGDLKNPCASIISLGISMGQWEVLATTQKTSSIGFIEDEPFQLVWEACFSWGRFCGSKQCCYRQVSKKCQP